MDEATMIGAVVIGLGALIALAKPLRDNTRAMTENTEQIRHLTDQQKRYEDHNSDGHKRLWEHNCKQDERLNQHDLILRDLENKGGD